MQTKNRITTITRRNISDELQIAKIWYHGRLNEPDFLNRLFNLKSLPSPGDRRYDNAYDDIYQHTVNNNDWESDWVFTDPRINLLHCDDETFLKFLSETIHPAVRNNDEQVSQLRELYNRNLEPDNYEIIQTSEISGKPVFTGQQKVIGQAHLAAKKAEIKKYLNSDYINTKINLMTNAVHNDTDLAIGTAKELLETTCKSILKQKNAVVDKDWTLGRLLKETTAVLDFKPKFVDEPYKAEASIKQILGGISSIVQGTAELRNSYGSGHGKDSEFKGLEPKFAKLIVGAVSEIAILYLTTNGETAELVE